MAASDGSCFDMEGLYPFLVGRGVPVDILEKMKEDKIDCSIINILDDSQLEKFLGRLGDRLAVREFCSKHTSLDITKKTGPMGKKRQLLSNLAKKVAAKQKSLEPGYSDSSCAESGRSFNVGNTNAESTERRVEVGWLNFDSKSASFKQVRSTTGGGVWSLTVTKSITLSAVMDVSINNFFPNGMSIRGPLENFSFEMSDRKGSPLEMTSTVEEAYDQESFPKRVLRFNLRTTPLIEKQSEHNDSVHIEEKTIYVVTTGDVSGQEAADAYPSQEVADDVDAQNSEMILKTSIFTSIGDTADIVSVPGFVEEMDASVDGNYQVHSPDEVTENHSREHRHETDSQDLVNDQPHNIDEMFSPSADVLIRIGCEFIDLVDTFLKDPTLINTEFINCKRLLGSGEIERGEGNGVIRDSLSAFWEQFYITSCSGTDLKVPVLQPRLGELEWKAVALVFIWGYKKFKYYPFKLAPVFYQSILNPAVETIADDELLENFKMFLSVGERRLVEMVIKNFDEVDKEELVDFLCEHEVRNIPTKENICQVMTAIAHKELVQEPMYVIKIFRETIDQHKHICNLTSDLFKWKGLTAKSLIQLIEMPANMNKDQDKTFSHLKKFVRELESSPGQLRNLLRYWTGSDMLLEEKLFITFTHMTEFERRPIAHTCTFTLELPEIYPSYNVFKEEINGILSKPIWVMDEK